MAAEVKREIIMGLDYGSKTVGVAVSDGLGLLRGSRLYEGHRKINCVRLWHGSKR